MTQTPHTKADRGGQRPSKPDSDKARRAQADAHGQPQPAAPDDRHDAADAVPAARPAEPSPANASARPGKDERRNRSI